MVPPKERQGKPGSPTLAPGPLPRRAERQICDGLDADDLRELTKKFIEVGNAPGTIAHHSRFDGQGGFVVRKEAQDQAKQFEVVLKYAPWIEFEVYPVTTIEEAFPVIQSVYG